MNENNLHAPIPHTQAQDSLTALVSLQVHQLLDLVLLQDEACDSGDKQKAAGSQNVQAAFDASFMHRAALMQTPQ